MPLEIQKGRSQWWYGRVTVNGRDHTRNLGVKIEGVMPDSLRQAGDVVFERSRAKAQAALDSFTEELRRKSSAEELIQAVHEIRTGGRIGSLPLTEFFARWQNLPRRKKLSERYVDVVESTATRFVSYLKNNYKSVSELGDVQSAMARAFMRSEEERGVSGKTYNNTLIFLRSACEALKEEAGIPKNPFTGIPTKEENTIHRKPFSTEELSSIVEHASAEDFIGPIIVTGICTAMREGDCCLLKWEAVDLIERFIAVVTSKTGETVRIPIFPLFEKTLLAAKAKSDAAFQKSSYVFPEQAVMYQTNADGITYRVRGVLAKVGFHDPVEHGGNKPALGEIRQERKTGLRRASIRDFHSFRVTWVTIALSAGVPIEIVQKVTGHQTSEIVQEHYFQPGKDDFRKALSSKLPALMGGTLTEDFTKAEIGAKLEEMNARNWRTIRNQLLTSLRPKLS